MMISVPDCAAVSYTHHLLQHWLSSATVKPSADVLCRAEGPELFNICKIWVSQHSLDIEW